MGKQKQKNEYENHHTNPWLFSIKIGFFAGLIWGIIRWMFYEMKFTRILPGFAADPFFKASFLKTAWGEVVGIAAFVLFSIAAALIYKVALGRLRGPWPGILYGAAWWAILFTAVGPMLGIMESVRKAGWNTLYTELCVFLLWGVFIGYSIAFEFTDEASREPINAH
jgi:magnesium-transporting ATPase (P-type)